ncbi:MAG: Gx transporter family protein [Clostridia bacterium]|nr:Gx transporter family protein [Clostridia bacterium]
MNNTKKLTTLSLLISVAMVLSYIESLIPAFVAVPGVKVGLSNIATVFALYTLGAPGAVAVSVIRVFLSSLLFGNFAMMIYSLAGAALALTFMILIKATGLFSEVGVSVIGGIMHNAGQIIAAAFMMENSGIVSYLVPLVISGTIAGVAVGLISALLIKRIGGHMKNI